jgi:hypothetical protein
MVFGCCDGNRSSASHFEETARVDLGIDPQL